MRVDAVVQSSMTEIADYRCASCGHTAKTAITVDSVGSAPVGFTSLERSVDTATEVADLTARAKIDEVLALVRCPRCGKRDAAATRRALWSRVGTGLAFAAIGAMVGLFVGVTFQTNPLIAMGVAAVVIGAGGWAAAYKRALSAADRLEFWTPPAA